MREQQSTQRHLRNTGEGAGPGYATLSDDHRDGEQAGELGALNDGASLDVAMRLRTEVPAAFWTRGCDPAALGIEDTPPDAQEDTRQRTAYEDLDGGAGGGDPLFED